MTGMDAVSLRDLIQDRLGTPAAVDHSGGGCWTLYVCPIGDHKFRAIAGPFHWEGPGVVPPSEPGELVYVGPDDDGEDAPTECTTPEQVIAAVWTQLEPHTPVCLDCGFPVLQDEPLKMTTSLPEHRGGCPAQACGACGQMTWTRGTGHDCELAPTGDSAFVSLLLLPTLVDLAGLLEAAFRFSSWHFQPTLVVAYFSEVVATDWSGNTVSLSWDAFRAHFSADAPSAGSRG